LENKFVTDFLPVVALFITTVGVRMDSVSAFGRTVPGGKHRRLCAAAPEGSARLDLSRKIMLPISTMLCRGESDETRSVAQVTSLGKKDL
jgi:hypothetical protein